MTPSELSEALCAWYRAGHRDLPWRRTRDPYRIWLSEVMLQQTQVETVLPYYDRFLTRFPTVADLAAAPLADVIKLWEGLGYYARCRNLHRAAGIVMREHGGAIPGDLEAVHALPGVGRSTAGAILTFAFDQPHPLLDGNVKRVLCRLDDVADDPKTAPAERALWARSEALLRAASDPWTHNQATMELGARLCTPREPQCGACPWRPACRAAAAGTLALRPVKAAKKRVPHHHVGVGVVGDGAGQVLIQLRPPEGLLGGLWEFPGGKQEPGEAIEDTVRRELAEELGIDVAVEGRVATVKHAYSHFKVTLHAFRCRLVAGTPTPRAAAEWRWVPLGELDSYAFPKANRRILEALTVASSGAL